MIATSEKSRHMTASMVVLDLDARTVLLVFHKATDRWLFPGGHVDRNETPAEAAVREVQEETGLTATITAQHPISLPGMTWQPSPWITAVVPAPAKPERSGKPAEPAHQHIEMLYIGTGDSRLGTTPARAEVDAALWFPVDELSGIGARLDVPALAMEAYRIAAAHLTVPTPVSAIYGPHCDHEECSWIACDHVAAPESGVLHACRKQATCPYCGPESPNWVRIATEWTAWCTEMYGTADSVLLRKTRGGEYPNVLATAELVEANPATPART